MPVVPSNSNSRVLVTGANGYVASWIVRTLLEQGYIVRGTVRSASKGKQLKEIFASYGDKFEWVVVNDITKDGILDECVKDVDAIEHTASPVCPENQEDPQGKSSVKRVVLTSSAAALLRTFTGYTVIDETCWGDEYVKIIEEIGAKAPWIIKYMASKTLAERAAWDFYEKHKASIGWEMVVLNPTHPSLQDFEKLGEETLSLQRWYSYACLEQSDDNLKSTWAYVDVRDVAAAHVESIKKEAAGGERILLSADSSTWQETRNLMFSLRPDLYRKGLLSRGNPELKSEVLLVFNSKKAKNILGIEYRSLQESTIATIEEYEKRGLLDQIHRVE
ncbi:NADPH-dependent methylglyoxal reductase GRE2 [Psilocybe cubensis]|uniref:NADPH-dependent methylglyoxal reductase GRE2 n=1 Tax=Psilocybe cubensis TaxID=181762 RepID=A0ACB8HI39_PSICU|nr:NADPH-dependent methylglyoxal reductase GRE2 [Psilocybe cubensis]KAH9487440.1 NADPH-dependent methylglyoxal reductase GRE2 [Psilocybe cubensis]